MLMQNMSSIRLDEDDEIKSTHQTARVNRINIKQPHIAPRVPPAEGALGDAHLFSGSGVDQGSPLAQSSSTVTGRGS